MGEATLEVKPTKKLLPFNQDEFGTISEVGGISVCTYLADRKVAKRQAEIAKRFLIKQNYQPKIEVINDFSNPFQKGSSIVLWGKTDKGVHLGSDAIGEIHKPSETVGLEASNSLLDEINVNATVDIHLADMLIPYMALSSGKSQYFTRLKTDHIESNLWLVSEILGIEFTIKKEGKLFRVSKMC
jgi:RNA 3'-terminal phosphate cyclase (ATP)